LVELREERDFLPVVVASPTRCREEHEIPADEIRDFTQYVLDGRVVLEKKKWPRFYQTLPGWQKHLKKTLYRRNHDDVSATQTGINRGLTLQFKFNNQV